MDDAKKDSEMQYRLLRDQLTQHSSPKATQVITFSDAAEVE